MSTYTAKEMIDFASWFQSAFEGANTEPTLNDLKTWEEGRQDWSGRND